MSTRFLTLLLSFGLLWYAPLTSAKEQTRVEKSNGWQTQLAPQALPFTPDYWLKRAPQAQKQKLSLLSIEARNQRLLQTEETMVYWPSWPISLSPEDIRSRILVLSKIKPAGMYVGTDQPLLPAMLEQWQQNLALDSIKASSDSMFGLLVKRAPVRRFPTSQRVFDTTGGPDIDRMQESALFPGSAVAVLHTARDGQWLFVQSDNYAGWVSAAAVAIASRLDVLAYTNKTPRRWITGRQEATAYTPEMPDISALPLDMGSSFPVLDTWPINTSVNGQSPLGAWLIELPTRDSNGRLRLVPALLPRASDSQPMPLSASAANVIRQSFKFLGERYGWGHDYHARDCSGFVSEVYSSMGIRMPRNTGDQQRSKHFSRMEFSSQWPSEKRLNTLNSLQVGDLVYIPGHVMLIIGHNQHGPWVIHDVQKSAIQLHGVLQPVALNGVSVTPLYALHFADGRPYSEAVTAVQRMLVMPH